MSATPKTLTGLCVGILSTNRILFQGPPDKEQGGFRQKILYLHHVIAPRIDPKHGQDERVAFIGREYLRKILVGKTWQFIIETKNNEMEIGYVLKDGQDICLDLVRKGLVKVRGDRREGGEALYNAMIEAEDDGVGLWSQDPASLDRPLSSITPEQIWSQWRKEGLSKLNGEELSTHEVAKRDFTAIVEEIHPSFASLYFPKLACMAQLYFSDVQVVILSDKAEGIATNLGQEKKSNVKAVRSTLESAFLSREVQVRLANLSEHLEGYLVEPESKSDVRKVLLREGFARLGKQAMKNLQAAQFLDLKRVAEAAMKEGKGLWKEQRIEKKTNPGGSLVGKSFMGLVEEVHSGDSFTVTNLETHEKERMFLPNVRAPVMGQPWSFESKDFLRRLIIGQRVKVEVEFQRKTLKKTEESGKTSEGKDMVFASVFLEEKNVAVCMLEEGLVSLVSARVEEDITAYLEEMRTAETAAAQHRKGVHGPPAKIPFFNDLTGGKNKRIDATKTKSIYQFMKDDGWIPAVVEIVLNGSRFILRLKQLQIVAVIEGIRCLPNEGPFAVFSNKALAFSKETLNQRDVSVLLTSVDPKGVFHVSLRLHRMDYALELLDRGLAFCFGRNVPPEYGQIEKRAKDNKLGLWGQRLDLSQFLGEIEPQFQAMLQTRKGYLREIVSEHELYFEDIRNQYPLNIPQQLTPPKSIDLHKVYAVKFSLDQIIYRGKILKENKNKTYTVQYIDYGNIEAVSKENIGTLDQSWLKHPPKVIRCSLYGLEELTQQGVKFLQDFLNLEVQVRLRERRINCREDERCFRIEILDRNASLNSQLVEDGEARCTVAQYEQVQQEAKKKHRGIWSREQDD